MGSVREDIADKLVHWKDDICRMVENECKTTANSPATTTDQILSLVCKRIEGAKLTLEQVGDIEWDSPDLDMRFVDDHPKEVNAILDAQLQAILDAIKEESR